MIGTTEAREIIGKHAPWTGGVLNHVTFNRLIDVGIVSVAYRAARTNEKHFERREIEALARLMPKKRPPNKKGIVNYLLAVKAGRKP